MSRRERILAAVIAALIVLFGLDYFVVEPALGYYAQLNRTAEQLSQKLSEARVLVNNRKLILDRWRAFQQAGLSADESDQRLAVQQGLSAWARRVGFNLSTLSTGRTLAGQTFDSVQFIATGSGSLDAVVRLLDHIHASDVPLRIKSVDITSRSDTQDQLTLRLTLSTVVLHRDSKTTAAMARAGGVR